MKIIEKPINTMKHVLSNAAMSRINGGSMYCSEYTGNCGTFDKCGGYTGDCTKFDSCGFFKDK